MIFCFCASLSKELYNFHEQMFPRMCQFDIQLSYCVIIHNLFF